MKDFKLDETGDLLIKNGKIEIISDKEEFAQKIKQVLGTNLGEWKLNPEEGIAFNKILVKNLNMDLVRDMIKNALLQVDETLELVEFIHKYNQYKRLLYISFKVNKNGEEIEVNTSVG